MKTKIHFDCRFLRGDRPCRPHKEEGVVCDACPRFSPWDKRILIIKLDAPGDVLRSTTILPELKNAYPHSYVAWLTKPLSLPLLANNPFLDEVIPWDESLALRLGIERFDLLLSLDSGHEGARAAMAVQATEKLGFGCNAAGQVIPLHPEAEEWYLMGLFDPIKKANDKSYPQILHEICRLPWTGARPVLHLTEAEKAYGRQFFARQGWRSGAKVVGLFTGAGQRWRGKSWSEGGFVGLVDLLLQARVGDLLLLGGPEEEERNQRLLAHFSGRVSSGGCHNTLREFAAQVDLCDVLVTADTLALHVATALGKKFVALLGPTSAAEIECYGNGIVLQPASECLCCYRPECLHPTSCLESLLPEQVSAAVLRLL